MIKLNKDYLAELELHPPDKWQSNIYFDGNNNPVQQILYKNVVKISLHNLYANLIVSMYRENIIGHKSKSNLKQLYDFNRTTSDHEKISRDIDRIEYFINNRYQLEVDNKDEYNKNYRPNSFDKERAFSNLYFGTLHNMTQNYINKYLNLFYNDFIKNNKIIHIHTDDIYLPTSDPDFSGLDGVKYSTTLVEWIYTSGYRKVIYRYKDDVYNISDGESFVKCRSNGYVKSDDYNADLNYIKSQLREEKLNKILQY